MAISLICDQGAAPVPRYQPYLTLEDIRNPQSVKARARAPTARHAGRISRGLQVFCRPLGEFSSGVASALVLGYFSRN